MPKRPYPRYRRRHDAILLRILENPSLTQKEIAAATGYSASQVSRILCSDLKADFVAASSAPESTPAICRFGPSRI
jgi:DNA-binding MarR family transcriptional regulator